MSACGEEPVQIGCCPCPDGTFDDVTCSPDGGATATERCRAGDDPVDNPADRRVTTEGDNGTFTDECDEDGSLVQHVCETDMICDGGAPPNPVCSAPKETGAVISEMHDCDGRCEAGACSARCPAYDDRLTYVSLDADGRARFDAAEDERDYVCDLGFDQPDDDFDCSADPSPGDSVVVTGLGLREPPCTGGVWGGFSTGPCSYGDCTFAYD